MDPPLGTGIMRGSIMALHAGTRLGAYEVLSLLGPGGMGEVCRARDTRLDREVAVMVLTADRVSDADRRRHFVQDAQSPPHSATRASSRSTIESANGNDFIVMEYVRRQERRAWMRSSHVRDAPEQGAADCDRARCAHARGIIHRDLKPANVIVGTDQTVKVPRFRLGK
jgi:eukaryotic-like serine/threonine-protein kinase